MSSDKTPSQAENDDFLKEITQDFIEETSYMLDECENAFLRIENTDSPEEDIDEIFRLAHSIKGSANAIGIKDLGAFAHEVENLLMIIRKAPKLITSNIVSLLLNCNDAFKAKIQMIKEESTEEWNVEALLEQICSASENLGLNLTQEVQAEEIPKELERGTPEIVEKKEANEFLRVPKIRIDHLSDVVGELIILKSQLVSHEAIASSNDVRLNNIVRLLDSTLRDLQERSMELALDNLKGLFLKVQRIARDTSKKVGKPIQFNPTGDDVEIDRVMIDALYDPLLHLVRNSIDHGVESAQLRKERNKAEDAQISLNARQAYGKVIIEIKDDGGGIDPEKIFQKALEKQIVKSEDRDQLSDEQKIQLIFEPGFSTVDNITDLSGRGVGLDVVKTNITKLKGSIQVESSTGEGTCFRLILPMTQAVTEGMVLSVGDQPVVVPLTSVKEILCLDEAQSYEIKKGLYAMDLRGKSVPLYSLGSLLQLRRPPTDKKTLEKRGVLLETPVGLIVVSCHDVLEQNQLVVKGLGNFFENVRGVAGGAILGDGSIAIVLDIEGLVKLINENNTTNQRRSQDLAAIVA